MRFTLKNQNNEKFIIIAMDLRTNVYLLGKLCEEKNRIFIVIVAKSNSLEIWDCEQEYYFKDYDRAYEQFYKENLHRMDNEKVANIYSFMYNKVDYFSKFKTICLDEYPNEFNNYEKKIGKIFIIHL